MAANPSHDDTVVPARRPSIQKEVDYEAPETASGESLDVVLDPKKERKLLAKLDFAFVPIIMLTYLSCFLDRSNIGMALHGGRGRIGADEMNDRQRGRGRHAAGHWRVYGRILDSHIHLLRNLCPFRIAMGGAYEETDPAEHPDRPVHCLVPHDHF